MIAKLSRISPRRVSYCEKAPIGTRNMFDSILFALRAGEHVTIYKRGARYAWTTEPEEYHDGMVASGWAVCRVLG